MAGGPYIWALFGAVASHSIWRAAEPGTGMGLTRKICSLNATYKYLPSVEIPGQLSPGIGVPHADSTRINRKAAPTNRRRGTDNTFKRTPSRNRVVTSGVKWVATQNALKTHPRTFNQTVFVDGLVGIMRTTWFKTARGRQNFREGHLVQPDHS